nr:MAG TPA: hypothetical protein [Caudoviricetes sp.]
MIMMNILSFLWSLVSILFLSIVAIMLAGSLAVMIVGIFTNVRLLVAKWIVRKLWRQEDGNMD